MTLRLKEVYIRWIGIPIVALIALFAVPQHMAGDPIWFIYLVSFAFTATYWNGACFFIFYFRKKFSQISQTRQRLFFTALAILVWMTLGGIPIKLVFGITDVYALLNASEHTAFLPFNFTAAIIITLGYEAVYFFDKWKETFKQMKH